MRCPVDGAELTSLERSGIAIDHCPTCRGVWLDRGELDLLVARAQEPVALGEPGPRPGARPGSEPPPLPHGDDGRAYGDKLDEWRARDEARAHGRPGRGFLEALFDF